MALLPRAKYLEGLVLNILATCIGISISLLAMWSGIKARQHTTPPGLTASYNSSQAAVCAIWFFCSMWAAGTVRAKVPMLQNCVYMYSVLTMITMTYAPRFHTMDQVISLIVELLQIFFIAFGIATAVSLFIFPMTTRMILFRKQTTYFSALREFLSKQEDYYRALGKSESYANFQTSGEEDPGPTQPFPEREALLGTLDRLIALHMELYTDTISAKREVAYGKLDADDLQQLFRAFRAILTPMAGIKTIIGVFDAQDSELPAGQASDGNIQGTVSQQRALQHYWSKVMTVLHGPLTEITQVIDEGLQHAAIVLEYLPNQVTQTDVESQKPGSPTFADYLGRKIQSFQGQRSEHLRTWAIEYAAQNKATSATQIATAGGEHLSVVLHVEHLISSIAKAVHALVTFADSKRTDGTMAGKRLVFPRPRHFSTKLGHSASAHWDLTLETSEDAGIEETVSGEKTNIRHRGKDPRHLPPINAWERYTNHLRAVPKLLRSKEATFGLRMALAAFSVGIMAFLEKTWTFYYQQRLIWPLIVILVAMNVSSGESTFKLAAQAMGATVAMVISYICWYIVDGKPAGVLVFTWLAFFALSYGFIKVPKFFAVWLCILVPVVAVIGTSLQSQKLGHAAVVASGQEDYPVYLSAPYRLLTVLAGCGISYFWTCFPYPITDRGLLAEKLGDFMFLLAKFQDCGHAIASLKMRGLEGDMLIETSPGRRLEKAQYRLFNQIMTLIPPLRMHALFQKFDLPIGGRFPIDTYMAIMKEATSIMNYTNLLIHSSRSWQLPPGSSTGSLESPALLASVSANSHAMTSILTLLSASVRNGTPLPPGFQAPPRVDFSSLWQRLSVDFKSSDPAEVDEKEEDAFRAWATMQMVGDMTNSALARMVVHVRDLIGEVDYDLKDEVS
ncbi:uncharacterized protein BO66DRAFT_315857 [Aspergillus aculeatinus CBS 121060]|uniref:Uncharacterized protein n=1 Tax=Aspergillus aculeatinus CBS 121060 TaxID=1448322 RepID=A0ACD1HIL6_9EURO|nr:hypothetical protein BO66DRAFT_315857 [Aspergillus aculeatinus CBS 121060]RAH73279.1 hypothetical protein BO66DRAFT_315857 [Aspergillus aculeatinus CBS 121060]